MSTTAVLQCNQLKFLLENSICVFEKLGAQGTARWGGPGLGSGNERRRGLSFIILSAHDFV